MIGCGICLLIPALLVPGLAVLWAAGFLSLMAGAVLHQAAARGHPGAGGRHPA